MTVDSQDLDFLNRDTVHSLKYASKTQSHIAPGNKGTKDIPDILYYMFNENVYCVPHKNCPHEAVLTKGHNISCLVGCFGLTTLSETVFYSI